MHAALHLRQNSAARPQAALPGMLVARSVHAEATSGDGPGPPLPRRAVPAVAGKYRVPFGAFSRSGRLESRGGGRRSVPTTWGGSSCAVHQNTLYIQTQGAYVRRDHQTIKVMVERDARLTVPLHHLEGIVCFGRVSVSPGVIAICRDIQLNVSFLTAEGKFLARLVPAISGNVLLSANSIARPTIRRRVCAFPGPLWPPRFKIVEPSSCAGRETSDAAQAETLQRAADRLACALDTLTRAPTLDSVRGCEGDAAKNYFAAFNGMIRQQKDGFIMTERSRRPPRDPLNALLSFLYALLSHDMCARWSQWALIRRLGSCTRTVPAAGRWRSICLKSFGRSWRTGSLCRSLTCGRFGRMDLLRKTGARYSWTTRRARPS